MKEKKIVKTLIIKVSNNIYSIREINSDCGKGEYIGISIRIESRNSQIKWEKRKSCKNNSVQAHCLRRTIFFMTIHSDMIRIHLEKQNITPFVLFVLCLCWQIQPISQMPHHANKWLNVQFLSSHKWLQQSGTKMNLRQKKNKTYFQENTNKHAWEGERKQVYLNFGTCRDTMNGLRPQICV